jgi:mono/diheme cytochrome c family protein
MIAARRIVQAAIVAGLFASLLVVTYRASSDAAIEADFADTSNAPLVTFGKQVYINHCASCHGKMLQGQPLWQLNDQFAGRRAPAHDETGHTWRHSDDELFHKTKFGRFTSEPTARGSAMPAFAATLTDRQILGVLAYIKSRWPLGMRVAQAMLNPDFAGVPADIDMADWRLPPSCETFKRHATPRAAPALRP